MTEHHHPLAHLFGFDPEAAQRAEMEGTSFRHDLNRIFEEMGEDELRTFITFFHGMSNMPVGVLRRNLSYTEGVLTMYLEKFGVCPACGTDHSKVPDEMQTDVHANDDEPNDDEPNEDEKEELKETPELLEEYNLQRLASIDEGPSGSQLVCKGCGMTYGSLADRMLREPGVEGCGGCKHKAKWG